MAYPEKFALLHIGDELLSGVLENRLTAPLASRIRTRGGAVAKAVVLPDDRDRVAAEIRSALRDGLAIVSTGGLGPTDDDITRDAFADALGTVTEPDPAAGERLAARRAARGHATNAADLRQALVLRGGFALANPAGDAVGVGYATGRRGGHADIFLLPGPPREATATWDASVAQHLAPAGDHATGVILVRTVGWRTASEVDALLRPLCPPGVALSFGTDSGVLDIRMVNTHAPAETFSAFARRVRELAGACAFGGAGDSLADATLAACRAAGTPMRGVFDIPADTDNAGRELNFALNAVRLAALGRLDTPAPIPTWPNR